MRLTLAIGQLQAIGNPRGRLASGQQRDRQLSSHSGRSAACQQQLGVFIRIGVVQAFKNLGGEAADVCRSGLRLLGNRLPRRIVGFAQARDRDRRWPLQVSRERRVGSHHCPVIEGLSTRSLANGPLCLPTKPLMNDGQSEASRDEVLVQDSKTWGLDRDLQSRLDGPSVTVDGESCLHRPDLGFLGRSDREPEGHDLVEGQSQTGGRQQPHRDPQRRPLHEESGSPHEGGAVSRS